MAGLPTAYSYPNFDLGLGRAKKGIDFHREDYVLGTLGADGVLFSVASVAASQATTTVQAYYPLPCRVKIAKVVVFCSAIGMLDGSHSFNIVLGTASYSTSGSAPQQTFTFGGTPTTGDTATATINGVAVTPGTITTGQTVAQLATALANNINATVTTGTIVTPLNQLVYATASAGVVTITAAIGTAGNAITTTAAATGGHTTLTAGGATMSGGVNSTAATIPGNDNSSVPNVSLRDSTTGQTTTISGGAGICTNPAVAGNAFFANDILFNATNFPNLTVATGTGATYAQILIPNNPDAVWPNSGVLTLRCNTPAGGSITNLIIGATIEPQPLAASYPSIPGALTAIPGITSPGNDF